MKNSLSITREEHYLHVTRKSKRMVLSFDQDTAGVNNLICRCFETKHSVGTDILAPNPETGLLVHRVSSFLCAYFPVDDREALEQDILRQM